MLRFGIYFEERDLIALFGDQYRRYRRQVSMLIPLPGRKYTGDGAASGSPKPPRWPSCVNAKQRVHLPPLAGGCRGRAS